MDMDTLILIILTSAAFGWFLALRIRETRQYVKECALEKQKERMRAERINQLKKK